MKKILILGLSSIIPTLAVMADHDARFFNALKTCSPYVSNGVVDTQGVTTDYKSEIVGWSNDKCVYKESVKFSGVDSCVTCRFSKAQLDELLKVMQAYQTVQAYSPDDVDITNIEELEKNPVVNIWNKYIQDSSICTMSINGLGN